MIDLQRSGTSCDHVISANGTQASSRPETKCELLAFRLADSILFEMAGTAVVVQIISLFFCCGKFLVKV